jgi:hypothetical protein
MSLVKSPRRQEQVIAGESSCLVIDACGVVMDTAKVDEVPGWLAAFRDHPKRCFDGTDSDLVHDSRHKRSLCLELVHRASAHHRCA